MDCKKCGEPLLHSETVCPECKKDNNENNTVKNEESENNDFSDAVLCTENEENNKTENFDNVSSAVSSVNSDNSQKKSSNKNAIIVLASIVLISAILVLGVVFLKNFIKSHSPDAVLEKCITASYNFDVDEYVKYSTINEECRQKLGDTEYDYDYNYELTRQAFEEMKKLTTENFGSYDVNTSIVKTEIYKKDSEEFSKYLNKISDIYNDDSYIEAFAKSTVKVEVKYVYNGETHSESDNQEIDSVLVDGQWYLIE